MRKLLMTIALAVVSYGGAHAADMPAKAGLHPVPMVSWTGFYGGFHAGAAWGYFRTHALLPGPTGVGGSATLGGQVGYNAQAGGFILGIEADASWIDIHARSTGARFDEDWMATLRLRLGYPVEQYLLYLTAGVALTQVKTAVIGQGSDSSTQAGFAGGFGVEKRFSPMWSGRVEALFVDVPTRSFNNGGFVTGGGSHNYVLRAAINYHLRP